MLMIAEILQAMQFVLAAILVGAIAFALLVITAYLQEELEYHPAIRKWFLQMLNKIEDLLNKITELVQVANPEFRMLYVEAKHRPRHRQARVENSSVLEYGFEQFARGFDRTGGLLQKHAPRHASGQLLSSEDLKTMGLAFPLSS